MALLYPQEHLDCYNYDHPDNGMVLCYDYPAGSAISLDMPETQIACLLSGNLALSTQNIINQRIEGGRVFLLPSGSNIRVKAETDISILIYSIRSHVQLCDLVPMESLEKPADDEGEHGVATLEISERMGEYFAAFLGCLKDGLRCRHYLEIKTQELFYLFRAYHTREELALFFRPLISGDTLFSDFVLKNYRKVKTIDDFASLSNYSRSGFKSHFKKTFGMSVSKWIRAKKAQDIYHELNSTNKSLQQISKEYDFASVSHMSIFCKEFFGMPPGRIRRANKNSAQ